jgi:glutamate/tyrosine decarboxylase-like PLP-dependent enzyme
VAQPSIPSLIGVLLAALYNPNLAWDEYSRRVAVAEVEASALTARLVGYDPEQAAGVFTFGGTGTTLYGAKIGLEKACPGAMADGVDQAAVLLASDASHYCRYNVAGWLGLGTRNLKTVPTTPRGEIDLEALAILARSLLAEGRRITAFVATMGSTDTFGLDDLAAIVDLRDMLVDEFHLPYRPHVHADAVIGWAWAAFNDYDFERNPLGFRPRTVRALAGASRRLRHLHRADSIGVDFHKTGFAPYVSSLFLVKQRDDLSLPRNSHRQQCSCSARERVE